MLPRLLSHFYCYAESRFSNPMVSGLAAYAMKRCSMKRKSIGCVIRSLSHCVRTRTLEAWSKSTIPNVETYLGRATLNGPWLYCPLRRELSRNLLIDSVEQR